MTRVSNWPKVLGQAVQQTGLFGEIPHEELPEFETRRSDTSDADQKGVSSRTSGETGRFGIEEGPLGTVGESVIVLSEMAVRKSAGISIGKRCLVIHACGVVPKFVGSEMTAMRCLDFLAGKPLFHEVARRPVISDRRRRICGRGAGVFAIDLRDSPPQ